MDMQTMVIRFGLIFILSLAFGLERQRAHKPIGFGTYMFVAMGACGLGVAAMIISPQNPLPLLGASVTGIGFLGAGALIKTGDKIFGFTSAASIWLFSIVGLTVGVGEYLIGIIIFGMVWIVLGIDRYFQLRGIGSYQKKLILTANRNIKTEDLESLLSNRNYKIEEIDVNKKTGIHTIVMHVEGSKEYMNDVPKKLFKTDWVESFRIE